jgi:putative DNA primase/helicase
MSENFFDSSLPGNRPARSRKSRAGNGNGADYGAPERAAIWGDTVPAPKAPGGQAGKARGNGKNHATGSGLDAAEAPLDETELSLVAAFVDQYHDRLRFNHTSGRWHEWTGSAWAADDKKAGLAHAMRLCDHASTALPLSDSARARVRAMTTARHVTEGASALPPLAASIGEFDRDLALLGAPGSMTNLERGRDLHTYPPNPADMISKQTAVAPAGTPDCPKWEKFLLEACGEVKDLIRFLKQWSGYCLTGDTREHALLFIYGPGGNGKSVFVNIIAWIMGDYARVAAMDTFVASNSDRHPTDLAMLAGARLVIVTETGEGRTWDEGRLKQMTGGDPISARFMRQDFFTYVPQFKLIVIGNTKPALRAVDDAVRRRINIVNFLHKPADPNKNLEAELRTEAPGILRWMMEGCLDWQKNGLVRPKVVIDATADYFASQDTLARWIEDECETGKDAAYRLFRDSNARLWASWSRYAERLGEEPGTQRRFSDTLERLEYKKAQNVEGLRGRGFIGLRVKPAANRKTGPASDDD